MATATNWKNRFTYKTKHFIEHQVNGNVLRFYPNRIGLLQELAEISKPIAHALATLIGEARGDSASSHEILRKKVRKDKEGNETCEEATENITVMPVSAEIADHRRQERNDAIDALLDGLTDERNKLLLGKLLMDSLREEFAYKKDRTAAEVEEFLYGKEGEDYEGLDTPLLVECVSGWLKANAKVFGKMGEKVTGLVKGKLDALQSRSASEATTSTVDGSSSKTPSQEPSEPDSSSTN